MDLKNYEVGLEMLVKHKISVDEQKSVLDEKSRKQRIDAELAHLERLRLEPANLANELLYLKATKSVFPETGRNPVFDLRGSDDYKSAKLKLVFFAAHAPRKESFMDFNLLIESAEGYVTEHNLGWAVYHKTGMPLEVNGNRNLLRDVVREAAELQGIPVLPLELPPEDQAAV